MSQSSGGSGVGGGIPTDGDKVVINIDIDAHITEPKKGATAPKKEEEPPPAPPDDVEKEKKEVERLIKAKERELKRALKRREEQRQRELKRQEKEIEQLRTDAENLLFVEYKEEQEAEWQEIKASLQAKKRKQKEEDARARMGAAKFAQFNRRTLREEDKQRKHDVKRGLYSPVAPVGGAPFADNTAIGTGKFPGRGATNPLTSRGARRDLQPPEGAEPMGPAISGLVKKQMSSEEQVRRITDDVLKGLQQDLNPRIRRMERIATDPQGFVAGNILNILRMGGPHGAAIASAITAIVAAPHVLETIIKQLAQKGLPLNDDWRRAIEKEVDGLYDVQEKKKRLLGVDGFIVTQTNRYVPDSGALVYNSFENRPETITSKSIGLAEKAVGIE